MNALQCCIHSFYIHSVQCRYAYHEMCHGQTMVCGVRSSIPTVRMTIPQHGYLVPLGHDLYGDNTRLTMLANPCEHGKI